MANFKKHVYNKELLAPIVAYFFTWEEELRLSRGSGWYHLVLSRESLIENWEGIYWWLFRVQGHSSSIISHAMLLLENQAKGSDQIPFNLDLQLKALMYDLTILSRYARLKRPSDHIFRYYGRNDSLALAIMILDNVKVWFMLSNADEEWLDRILDASSAGTAFDTFDHQLRFYRYLDEDRLGRLVFKRLGAVISSCSCLQEKSELRSSGCSIHTFIGVALAFRSQLSEEWWHVGSVYGGWQPGDSLPSLPSG